jgi:hypothetical protein
VRLLTIGYEGRSLAEYLGLLREAGCTLLCDVRRNAFSHKRGFSKRALADGCAGAGIRYEHRPGLGIASADRRGADTPAGVAALFARYRQELPGIRRRRDRRRAGIGRNRRLDLLRTGPAAVSPPPGGRRSGNRDRGGGGGPVILGSEPAPS